MTILFNRSTRDIDIEPELLVRHEDALMASYSMLVYSQPIEDMLEREYGRSGLCLKLFREVGLDEDIPDVNGFNWQSSTLPEASWAQNVFAIHGMAARVYDIVRVNGNRYAQVTDYLTDPGHACPDDIYRLMFKNGIQHAKPDKCDIDANRNWRGRKLIDCGGFFLSQHDYYERKLARLCRTDHGQGYESLPELGVTGKRDMAHRIERMGLADVDFTGKLVLDLGCNTGAFTRYATERGAKRVVGVDRYTATVAAEVANYLGYWNIDYLALNLARDKDQIDGLFDIVFCLSVVNHIDGYAEWISRLLSHDGIMFFEEHGKEPEHRHMAELQRDFEKVTYLGTTEDNHIRHLFRCEGNEHVI